MLSRRDRELAREIGFRVRHGSIDASPWGPMPALIAWPGAVIFGSMSYWLRDTHSLFWGGALFIAATFIACHALWRERQPFASRLLNCILFGAYSAGFWLILRELWLRDYWILSGLIALSGLMTVLGMISALFLPPLPKTK